MLNGLGDMMNMLGNMKNVHKMAKNMQKEMGRIRVESEVGGGAVKVTADGNGNIISIKIDPDMDDIKAIEGLMVNGVNDALKKAKESAAKSFTENNNLNIPPGMENILKNMMG